MKRRPFTPEELTRQVRRHLVYEIKWLVYAAHEFAKPEQPAYVAFLDSAAVHARNLLEFVGIRDDNRFTLHALGGAYTPRDDWYEWTNNRVIHMLDRDHMQARWPEGREAWEQPDKFVRMAAEVLRRLRHGGDTIPEGGLRDAYLEVIATADAYLLDPSEATHQRLAELYDDTVDAPYPA